MRRKRLATSDFVITPLGFGGWTTGGSGLEFVWSEQDDPLTRKREQASPERGIAKSRGRGVAE
jgi:aryl-alcohol dehydrogenase-like predicted oxidoreductase